MLKNILRVRLASVRESTCYTRLNLQTTVSIQVFHYKFQVDFVMFTIFKKVEIYFVVQYHFGIQLFCLRQFNDIL